MKIHSSSLTFTPSGNNSRSKQLPPSAEKENKTAAVSLSLPSEAARVDKKMDAPTLDLITKNIEPQIKVLSNPRTAYAVNAYIQENSQTLKNQRSELISGIDLFA